MAVGRAGEGVTAGLMEVAGVLDGDGGTRQGVIDPAAPAVACLATPVAFGVREREALAGEAREDLCEGTGVRVGIEVEVAEEHDAALAGGAGNALHLLPVARAVVVIDVRRGAEADDLELECGQAAVQPVGGGGFGVTGKGAGPGFPAAWTNPFNRSNRDSGAIIVGAGAPPPGTHGRDHGPDRSRLAFSNYGALVDAQGWGREVTTCGYGWLQGGADERLWYTDQFSGTSSASPVVVGAVACVQGNRKAKGLALFTPAQMRNKLRTTGSPQTDAPGRPATQRIGNRPNLKSILGIVKPIKEFAKEVTKDKIEKIEVKEIKEKPEKVETKEFKEKVEIKEVVKEKAEIKEQFEKQLEKRLEKQIEKQFDKQFDKQIDKQREGGGFGTIAPAESLEARLGSLEAAVTQIAHFISGELRPDLSRGALSGEQDLVGTQQDLDAAGKAAKDSKDLEKLGEQ